jgi:membrane-bound lytic murein transglycosylase B
MADYMELAQALVRAGFLSESNVQAATDVLAKHLEREIAEADDTKTFAKNDLAYQQRVIQDAEEMAEEDISMGDVGDRFIQAEIIDSAHALADKDKQLIERASEELAGAFKDATHALAADGLIDAANLKTATAVLADAWEADH